MRGRDQFPWTWRAGRETSTDEFLSKSMGETEQANPVYIFYSFGKALWDKAQWEKARWTGAGQCFGSTSASRLTAGAGIFNPKLETHNLFNNKAHTKKNGINPESRQGAE
jgi:hypothetical protein